jgi:Ca2+/Na+ antiporter
MAALVNVSLFFGSAAVIWVFSGYLIESVDRVARRFHKAGFTVAFFILGFLTSISEISVAFNSTVNGVPGVSAGNLIGASFVILLFIVPFLAIAGGGISLEGSLTRYNLLVALVAILLPAFFIIDGNVTPEEGIVALLLYTALLYSVRSQRGPMKEVIAVEQELIDVQDANLFDAVKILFGGLIIFGAGYVRNQCSGVGYCCALDFGTSQ